MFPRQKRQPKLGINALDLAPFPERVAFVNAMKFKMVKELHANIIKLLNIKGNYLKTIDQHDDADVCFKISAIYRNTEPQVDSCAAYELMFRNLNKWFLDEYARVRKSYAELLLQYRSQKFVLTQQIAFIDAQLINLSQLDKRSVVYIDNVLNSVNSAEAFYENLKANKVNELNNQTFQFKKMESKLHFLNIWPNTLLQSQTFFSEKKTFYCQQNQYIQSVAYLPITNKR